MNNLEFIKVENMQTVGGNDNPNQLLIHDYQNSNVLFQSYNSRIAILNFKNHSLKVDNKLWDYSTTTSRYFKQALERWGFSNVATMNHDKKEEYFKENKCFSELN